MSTVLTESTYLNDLLKWEMENHHSREQVTVLAGQDLIMGSVIGKIKVGAVPTNGTAGTNTGAVTCTGVTGGNKTKVGVYTLRCVTVVASGGVFSVKDPDGEALPEANVTVAYTNPAINFLLNDVGADAALGDTFTITVPVGSGKVKELNLAGIDGSEDAFGILIAGAGTTVTQKQVAYTSGGVAELLAGETLTGATSAATAQVVSFTLTSGTFAAGTAAGVLVVDNQVGTFQSENLNSANQADICTIGADTAVYYPNGEAVAIVRDAQIVADYLTWPIGASAAQKAAALVQLRNSGIVERTDA